MIFECCKCDYPGEDNTLRLVVKNEIKEMYEISEDGTLKLLDSDGSREEIYLECPVCGMQYNFQNDLLVTEDVRVLRKLGNNCSINPISEDDLIFDLLGGR